MTTTIQPLDFDGLLVRSGVLKRCTRCRAAKRPDEFGKNKTGKGGRRSRCKACDYEWHRAYLETHPEKRRESDRRYREANQDKIAEKDRRYREANRDKITEKNRRYREVNADKLAEHYATHGPANVALYRARQRGQLAGWADLNAIREFYAACPDGFQVDHVCPWLGVHNGEATVCGLHTIENLQYLTPTENQRKRERFAPAWEIFRPDLLRGAHHGA